VNQFLDEISKRRLEFVGPVFLEVSAETDPGTPLDRRGPPRKSISTKNQPRRLILRPFRGKRKLLPDCLQVPRLREVPQRQAVGLQCLLQRWPVHTTLNPCTLRGCIDLKLVNPWEDCSKGTPWSRGPGPPGAFYMVQKTCWSFGVRPWPPQLSV